MERIFELLPAGLQAEVYQLETTLQATSFSAGVLKGVQSRSLGGCALRVIQDGRMGFATATSPDSIPWMVQAALETAQMGKQTRLDWPTTTVESPALDQELTELTTAELATLADALQQRVHALNDGFLVQTDVRLVQETATVQNTAGGKAKTSRIWLAMNCGAELVTGHDILNIYGGLSTGRKAEIDLDGFVAEVFGPLLQAERVVAVPSGPQPVLLTSKAVASIIMDPLLSAFSGRSVQQRTSPLIGQLGERLFSENLTMTDDATLPMAPGTASMDDEGVPTRRLPLIEAGVVMGFAYDLNTAQQAGVVSTGHARRIGHTSGARLNSLPTPGFSNVIVQSGQLSFDGLLSTMGNGVVVDQISGTPGFNPSGEFTVTIQLGYLVRSGRIVGRIKNAMLSGNTFTALGQILALGKCAHWTGGGETGSLSVPAMVVDGLNVTAK